MSRSNAPLALSVVKMPEPGSVEKTAFKLREFDTDSFGFSHDYTWATMPQALRGVLSPENVRASISGRHPRVARCVEGLCRFGVERPLQTRAFADFPESGLRPISMIQWGPNVSVRVKASCWYINDMGLPVIPLLQPRKDPLDYERLSVYLRLARQAYCKGDWASALTEVIDLSGDDKDGVAPNLIHEREIPVASDELLTEYVTTYIAAKKLVDETKTPKPRKPRDKGMDDFFDHT